MLCCSWQHRRGRIGRGCPLSLLSHQGQGESEPFESESHHPQSWSQRTWGSGCSFESQAWAQTSSLCSFEGSHLHSGLYLPKLLAEELRSRFLALNFWESTLKADGKFLKFESYLSLSVTYQWSNTVILSRGGDQATPNSSQRPLILDSCPARAFWGLQKMFNLVRLLRSRRFPHLSAHPCNNTNQKLPLRRDLTSVILSLLSFI